MLRSMRSVAAFGLVLTLATPAHADEWLGRDKALHFGVSAGIAAGGYAGTAAFTDDRTTRLLVGAGLALGAGAGKELWDLAGHGDPSAKDLAWDVVGTATGLAFAWLVDRLVTRYTASMNPISSSSTSSSGWRTTYMWSPIAPARIGGIAR